MRENNFKRRFFFWNIREFFRTFKNFLKFSIFKSGFELVLDLEVLDIEGTVARCCWWMCQVTTLNRRQRHLKRTILAAQTTTARSSGHFCATKQNKVYPTLIDTGLKYSLGPHRGSCRGALAGRSPRTFFPKEHTSENARGRR